MTDTQATDTPPEAEPEAGLVSIKPEAGVLAAITRHPSKAEAADLQRAAVELVDDDRFHDPVPRFLTELPFGGDNDEITDRIAAAVLFADDPDDVLAKTKAGKDLVGAKGGVTVWDLRVMNGALEGGWKAYLLLDVTVGESDEHILVNTGAKQTVTRLARAWAEGALPIRGAFAAIARAGASGNLPVAFIAESNFE